MRNDECGEKISVPRFIIDRSSLFIVAGPLSRKRWKSSRPTTIF
jgi:hypothetical protein